MGCSQYIGFLLWTMVLCAQRPPNELFPLTPLNQEQQIVFDELSNRSVSTLSEAETFTLANIYLQDRRYSKALSFYDMYFSVNIILYVLSDNALHDITPFFENLSFLCPNAVFLV